MEITRTTLQESSEALGAKHETKGAEQVSPNNKEMDTMKDNSVSGRDNYTAVSKDGDTLEIDKRLNFRVQKTESEAKENLKISDASLAKCSSTKLKQMLQQGKISKRQYDKAMKKTTR